MHWFGKHLLCLALCEAWGDVAPVPGSEWRGGNRKDIIVMRELQRKRGCHTRFWGVRSGIRLGGGDGKERKSEGGRAQDSHEALSLLPEFMATLLRETAPLETVKPARA